MGGEFGFGPRTDVRAQFATTRDRLVRLLDDLPADAWRRPTAAAPWTVHDVVAHVVGDDVNRLSRSRDGHSGPGPGPGEDLAAFIHRINAEWVAATGRTSPRVLVSLLRATTPEILEHWRTVDLDRIGEPVTWAGPGPAPAWLDCARDFTEYWVHQEQIREAVGADGSTDPDELHAVLDTFLRAVPYTLRDVPRGPGTTLAVRVDGAGGGTWHWSSDGAVWRQVPGRTPTDATDATADTTVTFAGAATLWRLCTRMLEPADVRTRVGVRGDADLAQRLLRIVSVIR